VPYYGGRFPRSSSGHHYFFFGCSVTSKQKKETAQSFYHLCPEYLRYAAKLLFEPIFLQKSKTGMQWLASSTVSLVYSGKD
jgi:hypothetical protein